MVRLKQSNDTIGNQDVNPTKPLLTKPQTESNQVQAIMTMGISCGRLPQTRQGRDQSDLFASIAFAAAFVSFAGGLRAEERKDRRNRVLTLRHPLNALKQRPTTELLVLAGTCPTFPPFFFSPTQQASVAKLLWKTTTGG